MSSIREMGMSVMQNRRSRTVLVVTALVALAGLVLVPIAAGDTGRVLDTGTVNVEVKSGGVPVRNAEVFLNDNVGGNQYGCTDVNGMLTFFDVAANVDLRAATGMSVNRDVECRNVEFLRADGKKVYWEAYDNLPEGGGGIGTWTPFQVTPSGTIDISFSPDLPTLQSDVCAGHTVTIKDTGGHDFIRGTNGDDVINALGGDDIVYGQLGNDIICGGFGADTLLGEGGADYLVGEGGNDTMIGGPGPDWLVGGPGADTMMGLGGPDNYIGGDGGPDRATRRGFDKCWWTDTCVNYGTFWP